MAIKFMQLAKFHHMALAPFSPDLGENAQLGPLERNM